MVNLVVGIVFVGLCIIWVIQFVNFMRMQPEEFVSTHDRLIWAGAFCFVFFAAPLAFLVWKMTYEPPEVIEHIKPNQDQAADQPTTTD